MVECARCGSELQADDRFCGDCGTPVQTPVADTPPPVGNPALEQTVLRSTVLAHLAEQDLGRGSESQVDDSSDESVTVDDSGASDDHGKIPESASQSRRVGADDDMTGENVAEIKATARTSGGDGSTQRNRPTGLLVSAAIFIALLVLGALVWFANGGSGSKIAVAEEDPSSSSLYVVEKGGELGRDDERARGVGLGSLNVLTVQDGRATSVPGSVLMSGDRLFYVDQDDDGTSRLMMSTSVDDEIDLLEANTFSMSIVQVDSTTQGVAYFEDRATCLRIEGEDRPQRLVRGDTCNFSLDMQRAYSYNSNEDTVEVDIVRFTDGELIGSFEVDGDMVLASTQLNRFVVLTYEGFEQRFVVYDDQGNDLGYSDSFVELDDIEFANDGSAVVTTVLADGSNALWGVSRDGEVTELAAALYASATIDPSSGTAILAVGDRIDDTDLLRANLNSAESPTELANRQPTVETIFVDEVNGRFFVSLSESGDSALLPVSFDGTVGERIDLDEGDVDAVFVADGNVLALLDGSGEDTIFLTEPGTGDAVDLISGPSLSVRGAFGDALLAVSSDNSRETLYAVPLSGEGREQELYDASVIAPLIVADGGRLLVSGSDGLGSPTYETVAVELGSREFPETMYDSGRILGVSDQGSAVAGSSIELPRNAIGVG